MTGTWGIVSGLAAALFQSGGYVLARIGIRQQQQTPLTLLLAAQSWLALASLPLLIWGWRDGWWQSRGWLLPLCGAALGTTGGEWMFFQAENFIPPSRLSSLLGLRVVLLALILSAAGQEHLRPLQWLAVLLAVLGIAALNHRPGGGFRKEGLQYVAVALGFYAVSDCSIRALILHLPAGDPLPRVFFAAALVNVLIGVALLPLLRRLDYSRFLTALPYSGCWFVKQLTLYGCYWLIGPVFGNVVMASRGAWAILLTLLLMHCGVQGLESPKSVTEWLGRIGATLVIAGAIVLYCLD